MPLDFHLVPIDGEHPGLAALAREASSEGFLFLARLIAQWKSGTNRFDQPGEQLLGAIANGELVGVCGLNRDPYLEEDTVGRLRHLYVTRAARGSGAGSALVARLVDEATSLFRLLRLRTARGWPRRSTKSVGSLPSATATRRMRNRFGPWPIEHSRAPHAGSRSRALPAALRSARGTEQTAAIPAARESLDRIAKGLSHKKKFNHSRHPSCPKDRWDGNRL
jgi:GNAT superfamily N-acetyltransferase